jgi:heptosyltransferase-2
VDVDAQTLETRAISSRIRSSGRENLKQEFRKILVIQTAFLGDAILTLPLIQVLKRSLQGATLDVVVTPQAAGLFVNHPAIGSIVEYDKRGKDRGIAGFFRVRNRILAARYDLVVVPHRSVRSALLARLARIPVRIGFDSSDAKFLFTSVIRYRKDKHEIERNLTLLEGLEINFTGRELPSLHPLESDREFVDNLLRESVKTSNRPMVAVAPGTIWNTKRWLKERFGEVARNLVEDGCIVFLVGGVGDRPLCEEIKEIAGGGSIFNVAGNLDVLQSAELIRRCNVIVSNDSAPMHIGVAMRTPVVAIFGATVPSFGFAPYGANDIIIETLGLSCRPCSIHGGNECPIHTFDCMRNIEAARVLDTVRRQLAMRR